MGAMDKLIILSNAPRRFERASRLPEETQKRCLRQLDWHICFQSVKCKALPSRVAGYVERAGERTHNQKMMPNLKAPL